MSTTSTDLTVQPSWKPRVLILGAVIGALTGMTAAYLLSQRFETQGEAPRLNAGEGVKLGVLVFGLLRQIALLGGPEK
jgi:hypothetical protein